MTNTCFHKNKNHSDYNLKTIREDRQKAEESFVKQPRYLWMQHVRKAGGTTLCMTLRLNQMGLIRSHQKRHKYDERQTCQIRSLCFDCDVKKEMERMRKVNPTSTPDLSSMVKRVMDNEN